MPSSWCSCRTKCIVSLGRSRVQAGRLYLAMSAMLVHVSLYKTTHRFCKCICLCLVHAWLGQNRWLNWNIRMRFSTAEDAIWYAPILCNFPDPQTTQVEHLILNEPDAGFLHHARTCMGRAPGMHVAFSWHARAHAMCTGCSAPSGYGARSCAVHHHVAQHMYICR